MKNILKNVLLFSLLSFSTAVFAVENLQFAEVKKVLDGDTVLLDLEEKPTPIRLTGIDCFETNKIQRAYKQAYVNNLTIEEVLEKGIVAKKNLSRIIKENHSKVYFKCTGVDKYSRLLGTIYTTENQDINKIMVDSGYCTKFVYSSRLRYFK